MQLETSRFFSDRLVFDDAAESKFQIRSGFWEWLQRIVSWIWSPSAYSEENRRTVQAFQNYLTDTIGAQRLQRISSRFGMNWEEMEKSPLLSRDVAKILVGTQCVSVEDIQGNFLERTSTELAQEIQALASRFNAMWQIPEITEVITGRPTEWLSGIFYDPFLAARERLQLIREHPQDSFENFMHNMLARVIKRELNVGEIIPAPNHQLEGRAQFYYVSGKLATGKGMLSYIFHPLGNDTDLSPMRLFRGTSPRNSELDALSTVITDFEQELGMKAYRSGMIFEPLIHQYLGAPPIEGGHSMGSTLVQHRLVAMEHIQTAYLYCGPGITEREVERFNEKNPEVHLIIRLAENDCLHQMGEAHLGYRAPPNVRVDFVRYRPSREHNHNPHVSVWGRMPEDFVLEEIPPESRDAALYHRGSCSESFRCFIGPPLAFVLECLRDLIRFFFSSRIHEENGLKIGHFVNNQWRVDHFRAV